MMERCFRNKHNFMPKTLHTLSPPSFHSTHLLFGSQFSSEVKCLPNLPSFHPSFLPSILSAVNRVLNTSSQPSFLPFFLSSIHLICCEPHPEYLFPTFHPSTLPSDRFLFPSNGKDFLNLNTKINNIADIVFLFPSNGKDFLNVKCLKSN